VYTVADVVTDYVAGHLKVHRQASGASAVEARLTNAIAPLAKIPAAGLTRRMAFDLIAGLVDTPVAAKSVRNEMGAAWNLALDAGKLPEDTPNWWRQIMVGKLRSRGAMRDGKHKGTAKRTLSGPEIRTLMQSDMALFSRQVRDFLIIQLWTCVRGAEIVQMRREQITHESDGVWWTIPKEMTKGMHHEQATDLRVPLIGLALEVVQRLCETHEIWLFPSISRKGVLQQQKQTYMQSKVNYRQPYCKLKPEHVRQRLTVTHWSPHDLRRTGRTMLAALGCPKEVGEAILGHIRPGVEGIYNQYEYDAERRLWLQRWSDRLEELLLANQVPVPAAD
jgi:integrase